jgi:hypothetical protein
MTLPSSNKQDEATARFKIDWYDSSFVRFALYHRKRGMFGWRDWKVVERYETKDKAVAHYESIKDLPEYLP